MEVGGLPWRAHCIEKSRDGCLRPGREGGTTGTESSAARGVVARTVISRGEEEASVVLTAPKIGFSFAASSVLTDMEEGRIGGRHQSSKPTCNTSYSVVFDMGGRIK